MYDIQSTGGLSKLSPAYSIPSEDSKETTTYLSTIYSSLENLKYRASVTRNTTECFLAHFSLGKLSNSENNDTVKEQNVPSMIELILRLILQLEDIQTEHEAQVKKFSEIV